MYTYLTLTRTGRIFLLNRLAYHIMCEIAVSLPHHSPSTLVLTSFPIARANRTHPPMEGPLVCTPITSPPIPPRSRQQTEHLNDNIILNVQHLEEDEKNSRLTHSWRKKKPVQPSRWKEKRQRRVGRRWPSQQRYVKPDKQHISIFLALVMGGREGGRKLLISIQCLRRRRFFNRISALERTTNGRMNE